MLNPLTIAFILSSIATASLFSWPPSNRDRLIVVELDRHIPQSPSSIAAESNENLPQSSSLEKNTNQFESLAADDVKSVTDKVRHITAKTAGKVSATAAKTADIVAAAMAEVWWKLAIALLNLRDIVTFVGRRAGRVVHLLGIATAYGTCVWVTFASNHVLESAIPRRQFGIVRRKIYAVYFRVLAVAIDVGLVGHFLRGEERLQLYNLIAILGIVILNMVWLEPKVTKVMFERMKLKKEEGRGRNVASDVGAEPAMTSTRKEAANCRRSELKKTLKSLNSYSYFLNVLTLMGLTWHLVYLA